MIILKISNKVLVKVIFTFVPRVGFDHVIVSQAHADTVGIEHWPGTVNAEGTDFTPVT